MTPSSDFEARACELARQHADGQPAPTPVARALWRMTLDSLGALRSVLDGSAHATEERRLLEEYASAHVALLDVLATERTP